MIGLVGYLALVIAACIAVGAYLVWIMRMARRNAYAEGITEAHAAVKPALVESEEEINDTLTALRKDGIR